jgi:hypothetical protein
VSAVGADVEQPSVHERDRAETGQPEQHVRRGRIGSGIERRDRERSGDDEWAAPLADGKGYGTGAWEDERSRVPELTACGIQPRERVGA